MSMPTPPEADATDIPPCFEIPTTYDPSTTSVETPQPWPSSPDRLTRIEDRLGAIETALNGVGQQTTWIAQSIQSAFEGLNQMQKTLAEVGPMGLIKMMSGKGAKKENGNG